MATGPESTRSWENLSTTAALISPPILPPPRRPHESRNNTSETPTWDIANIDHSLRRNSEIPPVLQEKSHEDRDGREVTSRHLMKLPPLDTTQSSHRPLGTDQLPPASYDQYPSKRRRVEQTPGGWANPEMSIADSPAPRRRHGQPASPMTTGQAAGYHSDTLGHALAVPQNDAAWDSHAGRPSRDVVCCSPGCRGPTCAKLRSVVQDLVTEICARDPLASGITPSSEYQPPKPILPQSSEIGTGDALEWALQRLRWNNASLRNFLISNTAPVSDPPPPLFRRTPPFSNPLSLERMKRQHEAVDKDADATAQQTPRQQSQSSAEQSALTSAQSQDPWRHFEAMDPPGQTPFRQHRSASFSYGPPMASPLQPAQPARMLPSPSSLNLPMPPSLSSISSPSPMSSSSAHLAHLQELQHQVSVKQLALQTLQREHDSLLQRLERQRVRSQALEKKFEVSDAEINSLTDEKERLAGQVQILETQVEELQQARDEARKMGADSASQYMKIVEMAGRLQGKGVEDKKSWDKERETLLNRISELEGGHRTGTLASGSSIHSSQGFGESSSPSYPIPTPLALSGPGVSMNDETAALRYEVMGLKGRISALETALKTALEESKAVRAAALTLASVGQRLETSAQTALGGDDQKSEAHN